MKILKRTALTLICCLAVIGVYSLLKKPPQLHVDEKGRQELESIGIEITDTEASESGLSAVMKTVQGGPPIGAVPAAKTAVSSEVPAFMAGDAAPPFTSLATPPFMATDKAPAFAPAFEAAVPAPAYASAATEAPSEAPPFSLAPPVTTVIEEQIPALEEAVPVEEPTVEEAVEDAEASATVEPSEAAVEAVDSALFRPLHPQPPSDFPDKSPETLTVAAYQTTALQAGDTQINGRVPPFVSPPGQVGSSPPRWEGPAVSITPTPATQDTALLTTIPSTNPLESRGDFPVFGAEQNRTLQHSDLQSRVTPPPVSLLSQSTRNDMPFGNAMAASPSLNSNITHGATAAIGNEVFFVNGVGNAHSQSSPQHPSNRDVRLLPAVPDTDPAQVIASAGQSAPTTHSSPDPLNAASTSNSEYKFSPASPASQTRPANEHAAIYRETPVISFSQQQQPITYNVASSATTPATTPSASATQTAMEWPAQPSPLLLAHSTPASPVTSIPAQNSSGATFGVPSITANTVSPPPQLEPASVVAQPTALPTQPEVTVELRPSVERFIKTQMISAETGDPQRIHHAFIQLNRLYEHSEVTERERACLSRLLDNMAMQVIYARDSHILESPYFVKPGETLEGIARQHNIPLAMLLKINGLTGIQTLPVGTPLKILVGPFDAKISAKRGEMTLLLGGLYAGRVAVTLGDQLKWHRGERQVISKTIPQQSASASHPTDRFITLDNGATFREADSRGMNTLPNTLYLSPQDSQTVFDLLSENSVVMFEE